MNEQYVIFKKTKKSLKLKNRNFYQFYRNFRGEDNREHTKLCAPVKPQMPEFAVAVAEGLGKCSQLALYDTRGGTEHFGSGLAVNGTDFVEQEVPQMVKSKFGDGSI